MTPVTLFRSFPRSLSPLALCVLLAAAVLGPAACRTKSDQTDQSLLLNSGWENYRLGEFDIAIANFSLLAGLARDHDQNLYSEALYGEASCWHNRRDNRNIEKAAALYDRVIQTVPGHELASWASLAKVRLLHLGRADVQPDYDTLAKNYLEVYKTFPETRAGQEAYLHYCSVKAFNAANDPRIAAEMLSDITVYLKQHPDSFVNRFLYTHISNCHHGLGNYQEHLRWAVKAFDSRIIDQTNPNLNNSNGYWSLARIAEFKAGDFTTARKYYHLLVAEYPNDQRIYEVKVSLRRMDKVEEMIRAGKNPINNPSLVK